MPSNQQERFVEAVCAMAPEDIANLSREQCVALRMLVTVYGVPDHLADEWKDTDQLITERTRVLRGGTCECGVPVTVVQHMTHEEHMLFHTGQVGR